MYEFPFTSKLPKPIITYDTLTYPFDYYIWGITVAFTIGIFVILAAFQKIWAYASKEPNPPEWLFQGIENIYE